MVVAHELAVNGSRAKQVPTFSIQHHHRSSRCRIDKQGGKFGGVKCVVAMRQDQGHVVRPQDHLTNHDLLVCPPSSITHTPPFSLHLHPRCLPAIFRKPPSLPVQQRHTPPPPVILLGSSHYRSLSHVCLSIPILGVEIVVRAPSLPPLHAIPPSHSIRDVAQGRIDLLHSSPIFQGPSPWCAMTT